jgi:hypothetical protein
VIFDSQIAKLLGLHSPARARRMDVTDPESRWRASDPQSIVSARLYTFSISFAILFGANLCSMNLLHFARYS